MKTEEVILTIPTPEGGKTKKMFRVLYDENLYSSAKESVAAKKAFEEYLAAAQKEFDDNPTPEAKRFLQEWIHYYPKKGYEFIEYIKTIDPIHKRIKKLFGI